MDKKELRHKIKLMRTLLDESEKKLAAEAVFSALEKETAFLMANCILMYHSLPDEVSTHAFLDKWQDKKSFYLPRVNGVNLDILPYDKSQLELGSFHIEEPTGDNTVGEDDIELIIVPAVAYDCKGNRLGRGKGFYDRLLCRSKATKIGVGYDFQLVEEIEVEAHDVPVDIVITQTRRIDARKNRK